MSQNILSGTAAALLLATTAIPLVGAAESLEEGPQIRSASSIARTLGSPSQQSRLDLSSTSAPSSSSLNSVRSLNSVSLKSPGPSSPNPSNPGPSRPEPFSPIPSGPSLPQTVAQGEVVKIGEQSPASGTSVSNGQSSSSSRPATVIAKVHSHEVDGRKAATLYVRNIPVLTFLGAPIQDSTPPSPDAVKLGERPESLPVQNGFSSTKSLSSTGSLGVTFFSEAKSSEMQPAPDEDASEQRASEQRASEQHAPSQSVSRQSGSGSNEAQEAEPTLDLSAAAGATVGDPVARASEMAAMLNTLNRDGLDATQITVSVEETKALLASDRFVIKMGDTPLATLDAETMLPDSTENRQQDALQATNRLRRLLGNAEPLPYVVYKGKPLGSLETGAISSSIQGWASWYGPGFHGNLTANGEVFNQNDMTAAHQTLPFGTRVRVTNVSNGASVLVRITDRGPFVGDRILDLSMGAAQVLGLVQSGVGLVRLDILEKPVRLGSR